MESSSTGRRPKRSDSAPSTGEKTNCISAQAVPNKPKISAARGRVAAEHALDQLRQHRDDDAERDDVEQHDGEDEGDGGLGRRGRLGRAFHRAQVTGQCGLSPGLRGENTHGEGAEHAGEQPVDGAQEARAGLEAAHDPLGARGSAARASG